MIKVLAIDQRQQPWMRGQRHRPEDIAFDQKTYPWIRKYIHGPKTTALGQRLVEQML